MSKLSKTVKILKAPELERLMPLMFRGEKIKGYFVSRDGQIYSGWRRSDSAVIQWFPDGPLKPIKAYRTGKERIYLACTLRTDGKSIRCYVHRVTYESFKGDIPKGFHVCHNDGNPRNNCLDNLRCATLKENEQDKIKHGTSQHGENNPSAKLTNAQAEEIISLRKSGEKLKAIAEKYGIRESTVSRICNGQRRKL